MPRRVEPRRGDVFWVRLDPAIGTETKKTRPALILSNNAQNAAGQRVLVAPITSSAKRIYAFEAAVSVEGRAGKAMLDQVRCLDRRRLLEKAGHATDEEMKAPNRDYASRSI